VQPARAEPRSRASGGGVGRCELPEDPALRQRLPQVGAARVGDKGAVEDELLQLSQPLELHQPTL